MQVGEHFPSLAQLNHALSIAPNPNLLKVIGAIKAAADARNRLKRHQSAAELDLGAQLRLRRRAATAPAAVSHNPNPTSNGAVHRSSGIAIYSSSGTIPGLPAHHAAALCASLRPGKQEHDHYTRQDPSGPAL